MDIFKKEGLLKIIQKSFESRDTNNRFAIPAFNFYRQEELGALVAVSASTDSPLILQICGEYAERWATTGILEQGFQSIMHQLKQIQEAGRVHVTSSMHGEVDIDVGNARVIVALDHYDIKREIDVEEKMDQLERVLQCTWPNLPDVGLLRVNASFLGPEVSAQVTADVKAMADRYDAAVEGVAEDIDANARGETGKTPLTLAELEKWVRTSGVDFLNYYIGFYHGGKSMGAAKVDVDRLYLIDELQSVKPVFYFGHGGSSLAMPWEKGYDADVLNRVWIVPQKAIVYATL